jgi:hypothetical protein
MSALRAQGGNGCQDWHLHQAGKDAIEGYVGAVGEYEQGSE